MSTEEQTMEEKCDYLMNIVVESRKRFGKKSVDYDNKTSLMENKILNLQLKVISNYRLKSKNTIPNIDVQEMCKDTDNFAVEVVEKERKIQELRRKVKDTQQVVLQLKEDVIGRKVHRPLNAEAMLVQAKEKFVQNNI